MPLLAAALISAAVLAYEVLLTRLFSIIHWHHFAYMVISIALLGFGASGTVITLLRDRLQRRFPALFMLSAGLFAVTSLGGFALAQRLPFNALAFLWEPRQFLYLLALYLIFTVPFFFGASCIGLAFVALPEGIGRIYRYDLVGAGLGALGIVLALFLVFPGPALAWVAALGFLAAAAVGGGRASLPSLLPALLWTGAAAVTALALPPAWFALEISEYKGLSRILLVPGTAVEGEVSSPLGLITVVSSETVPFRHAPGLSLAARLEPPPQLGVFTDGDGLEAITRFDGRLEPLAYLDDTTQALPYHLLREPEVLLLGAGAGADVLLALYLRARRIDAVECNPDMVGLVRELHGDFAGQIYDRPEIRVFVAEARGFAAAASDRYDLVQLPLAGAGPYALGENYLYTVEAFANYLERLAPGGYLAITRWLKLPPRDSLKLMATALTALEQAGIPEPASRLALIRSWNTTTLLLRNGAIGPEEVAGIRAFAKARSFDLAYYPGIEQRAANRYNLLQRPYFFEAA